jgi:hypothetical protein
VGDRLVSVIEFSNTQGTIAGQGPDAILPDELTGIADITVVAIIPTADPNLFNIVFAPTGATGLLAGQPAGAMVALYLDGSPELNVINGACGTLATCQADATDGALWAVAGFNGDQDNYWVGQNVGINLNAVSVGGSSTSFGVYNIALNFLVNNTGQTFGLQSCALPPGTPCADGVGDNMVEITGSGNFLGGENLTNGWVARSDADVQVVPTVPEPGTLALLGAALLGGLGMSRRKGRA